MSSFKHFKALNWKNWLIWKRKWASSACEIVFPLLLMAMLVMFWSIYTSDVYEPQNYFGNAQTSKVYSSRPDSTKAKSLYDLFDLPPGTILCPSTTDKRAIVSTDQNLISEIKLYFEQFVDKITIGKNLTWFEFANTDELYSFVRSSDYDVGKERNVFCYVFAISSSGKDQFEIEIL